MGMVGASTHLRARRSTWAAFPAGGGAATTAVAVGTSMALASVADEQLPPSALLQAPLGLLAALVTLSVLAAASPEEMTARTPRLMPLPVAEVPPR